MAKLKSMGLFHTPQDVEELMNYVTSLPNDGERAIATTVMGMTWNLCAKLTNEAEQEPDSDFCSNCHEHTEFVLTSVCCGATETEMP